MKKTIYIICFILMMVLMCTGCQKEGSAENVTLDESSSAASDLENGASNASDMITDPGIENDGAIDNYLTSFESQLEASGLKLEDKVVKDAESIGALEGYGFNVNGSPLELYLFDPASSDEKTKENLKTAEESGYITIFGVEINGKTPKPNCTFHDSLVLIFPTEDYGIPHPDKEAIIQAFMEIS